ncbi:MAG: polyprenyl synthetase family protein [Eubacteriales bacterium]|nr:polyprenyl synthetase family protein [Eubacteriales bacterium]
MSEEEKLKVKEWIDTIGACPESMKGSPTGQVLEDAIASLGKMIRPWLLLSCASFGPEYEQKKEELYFLGALVELTHLSSLIHDDIIDDAPLRRGVASIQGKYGKDAAVYAGDFLIARMNYWEAKMGCNEATQILAHAVEEMCIGEIGQAMCRYHSDVTCKKYFDNIKGKTASLFRAACKIGAMTAGCSEEMVHVFERFGEHLGIMFQLRDDLIDFSSNGEDDGKKTHKDFQDGIYTLPVLMAMRSKLGQSELLPIMEENKKRMLTDVELHKMEAIVISHGGVKDTWEEIIRRANMCYDILDSFEHNEMLQPLRDLLKLLTKL